MHNRPDGTGASWIHNGPEAPAQLVLGLKVAGAISLKVAEAISLKVARAGVRRLPEQPVRAYTWEGGGDSGRITE